MPPSLAAFLFKKTALIHAAFSVACAAAFDRPVFLAEYPLLALCRGSMVLSAVFFLVASSSGLKKARHGSSLALVYVYPSSCF